MVSKGVEWRFNPPLTPHFGGVFEALIKSTKRALTAVLSKTSLTDEELHSAFVSAEGFLNKRPLTTVSPDPEDLRPLTPNHFLIGHFNSISTVEPESDGVKRVNLQRSWKKVLALSKAVWDRWLLEYVPRLNVRQQWHDKKRNMKAGDVVMYLEQGTARGRYPLGRIEQAYPGEDGNTRVVDVMIKGKVYRRPVNRLVPLESCDDTSESSTCTVQVSDTAEVQPEDVSG